MIQHLTLQNFKRFENVEIPFCPRLNVFVGVNGAGKSSILQALSILLSWYARRVNSPMANGNGKPILPEAIMHGAGYAKIGIEIDHEGHDIQWRLSKNSRAGKVLEQNQKSDLSELTRYIKELREEGIDKIKLPVLAFYTVNRAVLEIPQRIRRHHKFQPIDIYDDSSKTEGRVDFRLFFEWFREIEDKENERIVEQIKTENHLGKLPPSPLDHVKRAIENFLPEYSNIRIKRQPMRFCVDKAGETFNIDELSDGEKSVIALVGDISRKLIQANPDATDPLSGTGVVMIDEVELHLHPAWQAKVLPRLMKTFPHLQFIVTTHSGIVLSQLNAEIYKERRKNPIVEAEKEETIRIFQVDDGEIDSLQDPETGLILENKMDDAVTAVDEEFDRLLDEE